MLSHFRLLPALLALVMLPVPMAAQAQAYPSKTIRLILPFPPSGGTDALGRIIAQTLSAQVGHQVIADNRPGAGGNLGLELAAKAPPDGYTMVLSSPLVAISPLLYAKLNYDPHRDLAPVTRIGFARKVMSVHPSVPARSLKALVELARKSPGRLTFGSGGVGTAMHLTTELLKSQTGIDMVHVPYKGGGPAMIDVMAGHIPVMFTSVTQVLPHIRTGKIQMLAVGGRERSPAVPNVPTVIESGFPGYEAYVWWGIVAPAGVPVSILDTLSSAINAIVKEPATQKMMEIEAAVPNIMTRAEFSKLIGEDLVRWTRIAKEADIRAD